MEERIAKIERNTLINTILLSVITAVLTIFLVAGIVIAVKAVPVVREYKPVIDRLASVDVDALEAGLDACKKLSDANINMDNVAEALGQLDTIQESMKDFKDIIPKIEVIADAISSLTEKLEKIGSIFGR